ncbi:copper transporter [Sporohalobacter salinus]|uniref:copper transporter n=1 Tax=Sporohalobacter salinus TaxID=1494606 RepID=UPI0019614678|nr:cellobiose-specific phosphotransferase system component IIA [Sporohalobacter salinus]
MIIDLRYQIVTTVIIFLTLGIGILIGSSMIGKQGIVKEQKKLISRLENDFDYLRRRNNRFQQKIVALQKKIENNHQFQEKLFPLVLDGIISNKSVLIIHSNSNLGNKVDTLNNIFQLAGSRRVAIKSIDFLNKESDLDAYDYLIYVGSKKEFIDKGLREKYSDKFKKIKYLSNKILESKRKLMKYFLKLSGKASRTRSVQVE